MIIRYILSFILSFAVSGIGSSFATRGLSWYYSKIKRPTWTPGGKVIGSVWTVLFILTAIAGAKIWNSHPVHSTLLVILFAVNGILNIGWSYVFFYTHKITAGISVSTLLGISIVAIIILSARISPAASWLLVPYAAWVAFATYLNYSIARLNP